MVHEGQNVKRLRTIKGVKQVVLAEILGLTQQDVSAIEKKAVIEPDLLENIAKALKMTPEAIKNFSEEAVSNFIECEFTFNPTEKAVGLQIVNANREDEDLVRSLYEKLLEAEKKNSNLLQQLLDKERELKGK